MGGDERASARPRWLRVLRKEVLFPALVAILSGVVVLLVQYGVFEQSPAVGPKPGAPPVGWNTIGFADKVGAHSSGKIGVLDDGQVYLLGTIKDTRADGRVPALRIEVAHTRGPVWTSPPYPARGGNGATQAIGWQTLPYGARGMLLGTDVARVRVSDCLLVPVPDGDLQLAPEGCGGYNAIYQK